MIVLVLGIFVWLAGEVFGAVLGVLVEGAFALVGELLAAVFGAAGELVGGLFSAVGEVVGGLAEAISNEISEGFAEMLVDGQSADDAISTDRHNL